MATLQAAHKQQPLLLKTLVALIILSAVPLLLSAAMLLFWTADEVVLLS